MADIETKRIIEIEAKYETLADLAGAVTTAKGSLSELTKGTADYEKGLADLKRAQKDYNDMQRLAVKENGAAKGSYNDLVNQLNRLKQAWNATGDAMERAELTKQINDVKEQLGDLDHSIGNWQRNVGNYAMAASSSLGTFKEALEKGGKAGNSAKDAVDNLGLGMKLLSTNPLMGILVMLAPLINKITGELKENESALDAVHKMGKAMEPLGKAVTAVVQKLADWFSKAVDIVVDFAARNKETFGAIVTGAVGAGNAILQYMLTPFRMIADAAKGVGKIFKDIFTGDFKSIGADARAAGQAIGEHISKGLSFGANFAEGKAIGEALMDKIGNTKTKEKAKETGEAIGAEVAEGIASGIEKDLDKILAAIERKAEERRKAMADALKEFIADTAAENAAFAQDLTDMLAANQDALTEMASAGVRADAQALEDRKKNLQTWQKATASILNDVAGAYQNQIKSEVDSGKISQQEGEKRFKAVKAAQYAITAMNTASAVVAALKDGELPWIARAANAAAAGVAGAANMLKIANTSLGSTQKESATGQGVQLATNTAPIVQEVVRTTRIVTNAEDTASLAGAVGNIKAYVVTTELEGQMGLQNTAIQESTF